MVSLLLLIGIFSCHSQTFPSDWQDNGCIPEDEYFICISLDSVRNLDWIRNYISYVNIQLTSTSSTLSPIYTTHSYRIDNTNTRDTNDISICFYPDITSLKTSIQFNIYNATNNDNTFLASCTIPNIHSLNITTKQSAIVFTEKWNNLNNTFNTSQMTHNPQIRFSLWLSSAQCMEITTSTMYFANDYNLQIQMYRLTHNNNQPAQNTIFQTSKLSTYDSSPSFNSILCLSGYPISNTQSFIGANFTLNDGTTKQSYSLSTINNEYKNFYITPHEYWEQPSYDANILHFAIGNIQMNYWQSCSLTDVTNINESGATLDTVATDAMYYTVILLASLLFITLICICSGCYTCKSYKGTDPIHYSNVLWCLLAIWNYSSQVMFATFLILQIKNIADNEDNEVLLIITMIVLGAFVISYLCNLLYLIHYLQIWNDPSAPGVTRHWLELWSWLIIFITMTMGGVHVALELCNSIIIPIDVFSMHLSHSELVRIRKDKIITNVLTQDLPIFIDILAYGFIISFFDTHSEYNIHILNSLLSFKYIVIINVLLSTVISIITSSIFRIIRRNYSHDNPVAQYQFSFTLKSNQWQSYWIHSHKKIQKCFKNAFGLRKLSLTIIDQCSESLNSMKIEGRLLRDDKHKSERVEKMASGNVTKNEMQKIGLNLLKQFQNEFNIVYSDIRIDHLTIKPIFGGGEVVYNHRTCVQILCVGFLDCIKAIAHKCCPSFVKKPPDRRQSNIPIRSPRSYNSEKEYELSMDNISPSNISVDTDGIAKVNSNVNTPVKIYSNTMSLPVDKSKDESRSNSNSNLPMITVEENQSIEKEFSQSISTRNTSKLDTQTLFSDVYKDDNGILAELSENRELSPPHPPNIINPKEWFEKYKQIKADMDRKDTDQYGYESKRKITFLSHDEKLKQIAGDAPITFSASTNVLLANNDSNDNIDLYGTDDNEMYDDDDDEVDI